MNLDITNNDPICIIRVDGHSEVGFGHLSRTRTIAESLQNENIRCVFAITEKTISSSANAIISGFETIALRGNETLASKLTKNRIPAPAVLLIDHYGDGRKELLDSYFSDTLRVLIDDTSFHNKFCDLFINPNGFPNTSHKIADCSLFGPKYMPVSENIATLAGTWRANHTLSKPPICLVSLDNGSNAVSIEILNSLSKIEVSRKFEFKSFSPMLQKLYLRQEIL